MSLSLSQRSRILNNIRNNWQNREYGVFVIVDSQSLIPHIRTQRQRRRTLEYSYISQPKSQLQRFQAWAGKDGDISYYLNSHRIDIAASMALDYEPVRITAFGSKGTAVSLGCVPEIEDTVSLLVQWRKKHGSSRLRRPFARPTTGPRRAGVHPNQYFTVCRLD